MVVVVVDVLFIKQPTVVQLIIIQRVGVPQGEGALEQVAETAQIVLGSKHCGQQQGGRGSGGGGVDTVTMCFYLLWWCWEVDTVWWRNQWLCWWQVMAQLLDGGL